jgi:hypothetical protein
MLRSFDAGVWLSCSHWRPEAVMRHRGSIHDHQFHIRPKPTTAFAETIAMLSRAIFRSPSATGWRAPSAAPFPHPIVAQLGPQVLRCNSSDSLAILAASRPSVKQFATSTARQPGKVRSDPSRLILP